MALRTLIFVALLISVAVAVVARDRLHRSHWYFRIEGFVKQYPITLALLLALGVFAYGWTTLQAADRHSCARSKAGFAVLRGIIQSSDKAADAIVYYKEHPDELEKVHRQNAEYLKRLAPPSCDS